MAAEGMGLDGGGSLGDEVVGEVFDWGKAGKRGEASVVASGEGRKKLGGRFPLFPRGCLTIVMGEPRAGKSLLTLELAARVTLQSPKFPGERVDNRVRAVAGVLGEGAGVEGRVEGEGSEALARGPAARGPAGPWDGPETAIIFVREDAEQVVKMRLLAAGADRAGFEVFTGMSLMPVEKKKDIFADSWTPVKPACSDIEDKLAELMKFARVGLVVLDPLPVFFEGREDGGTVRKWLEPLVRLAERLNFSLVGVMHVKKNPKKKESAIYRAIGSQTYVAMARSVMEVTLDDVEGIENRSLVIPVKNNYAVVESAYAFRLKEWEVEGLELPVAYVEWEKEGIEHEWLRNGKVGAVEEEERHAQRELAKSFLRTVLAGGAVASAVLHAEARNLGISARTLTRAKMELGVVVWRARERWMTGMHRPEEMRNAKCEMRKEEKTKDE